MILTSQSCSFIVSPGMVKKKKKKKTNELLHILTFWRVRTDGHKQYSN